MDRRVFIKNGSMAMLALGFAPGFVVNSLKAAKARKKVLVTVFQRGAVDGLNMIVPFGEEWYYKVRPSIGVARPGQENGAVDLDGFFGMNPSMSPLADLFKRNELAVVHACGSPDPTRSHFDAQDYMESGTPGVKATRDGWLNRYLHAREHAEATPFRAVSLTQQLPRSLQGIAPALAISQVGQFGLRAGNQTDMMQSGFESQYAAAADKMLGNTGKDAFDAVKLMKEVNPQQYTPANGAVYPRSVSAKRCVRSRSSSKATSVSRSRSPSWAAGTRTCSKATARASSPTASAISRRHSRPSTRISAIACPTSSSSR